MTIASYSTIFFPLSIPVSRYVCIYIFKKDTTFLLNFIIFLKGAGQNLKRPNVETPIFRKIRNFEY